jgi:ABC-type polysaccharide/polyol phosphate export permease
VRILQFNPLAAILGLYRTALLDKPTEAYHWWGAAAWGVGLAVIGALTFRRMEHKLPRYLA